MDMVNVRLPRQRILRGADVALQHRVEPLVGYGEHSTSAAANRRNRRTTAGGTAAVTVAALLLVVWVAGGIVDVAAERRESKRPDWHRGVWNPHHVDDRTETHGLNIAPMNDVGHRDERWELRGDTGEDSGLVSACSIQHVLRVDKRVLRREVRVGEPAAESSPDGDTNRGTPALRKFRTQNSSKAKRLLKGREAVGGSVERGDEYAGDRGVQDTAMRLGGLDDDTVDLLSDVVER
mmetsp:Transcript_44106/g.136149  ORF Transcript_44106/g.136149 Transcript_44106/m.136149 type:complete len:236 (+) Transcript_44106:432-1139(+)